MVPRILAPLARELAGQYPVVTVTGPRQSGKTTLCRATFADMAYVNLESPDVRAFANDDPRGFLAMYRNGAVIDEIQRVPNLVSYLQPPHQPSSPAGQPVRKPGHHRGLEVASQSRQKK